MSERPTSPRRGREIRAWAGVALYLVAWALATLAVADTLPSLTGGRVSALSVWCFSGGLLAVSYGGLVNLLAIVWEGARSLHEEGGSGS